VGVAEHVVTEQLDVLPQLRLRVQAAAGVIEVDLSLRVESCVLGCPQLVHAPCRVVSLVPASEGRERPGFVLELVRRVCRPAESRRGARHRTEEPIEAPVDLGGVAEGCGLTVIPSPFRRCTEDVRRA
jgi:hypothetical protein